MPEEKHRVALLWKQKGFTSGDILKRNRRAEKTKTNQNASTGTILMAVPDTILVQHSALSEQPLPLQALKDEHIRSIDSFNIYPREPHSHMGRKVNLN